MISDGLWYAGTSEAQHRNDNCSRWSILHISVFASGMAFRHLCPENQSFVKGEWLVTVRLANHRIVQVGRDPQEACSPTPGSKWGQHWIQIRLLRTFPTVPWKLPRWILQSLSEWPVECFIILIIHVLSAPARQSWWPTTGLIQGHRYPSCVKKPKTGHVISHLI